MVAAAPSADRLQALINETSAQFQIAYRLHPAEGQQRQQQLNAVVAAWRTGTHTDTNNERLRAWLRTAIRASMPGSREALPPAPSFAVTDSRETRATEPTLVESRVAKPTPAAMPVAGPTPAETHPAEPLPAEKTAASTDEQSTADPFRDDPIDEDEQD